MDASPATTLRHFVLTHRRILAAAFAGLAMLFALGALRPSTSGVSVVVARHDLKSGAVIASGDLRTAFIPAGVKPSHSWASPDTLIGRRAAGPLRKGEVLTDFRLLEPGLLRGYAEGLVLSTIRVADPTQLTSLRVGDRVNIVSSDPDGEAESKVIARRAEILSLPRGNGGDASNGTDAPAIAVAVPESVGLELATAAIRSRLSVLSVP
ncbi:MAG: SAF domain-containing protein [Aeromicrobium sp.]